MNIELNDRPFPRPSEITEPDQVDELINKLSSSILKAQERSIPKVQRKHYSLILPDSIKSMIGEKHRLMRRLKRNPGLRGELMQPINDITVTIDEAISELRNNSFNQMFSRIPDDGQHKSLYQTAKFLRNRHQQMPHLKVGDNTLITPLEKADTLVEQFQQNHKNNLETNNRTHTDFVNRSVTRFLPSKA